MIVYVKFEVGLHNLEAKTVEQAKMQLREALELRFGERMESDIEIEVIEHAGTEE